MCVVNLSFFKSLIRCQVFCPNPRATPVLSLKTCHISKGEVFSCPEFLPSRMSELIRLPQHLCSAVSPERCTRAVATGFPERKHPRGAKAAKWNHHHFSPLSDITHQGSLLSKALEALFLTWRKRFHFGLTWNREGMLFSGKCCRMATPWVPPAPSVAEWEHFLNKASLGRHLLLSTLQPSVSISGVSSEYRVTE